MHADCTSHKHPYTAAYTLIEIAVVLVIIGVLAGGVLVGRSLLREAALQSVASDIQRFKTAIIAFKVKYNCLPGDCSNATDFFGTDPYGCPRGGGPTGTCNGNGDGYISLLDVYPLFYERYRSWQQLAYSGLIQGTYTGVSGGGPDWVALVGVNTPASTGVGGGGYMLTYMGYYNYQPDAVFVLDYGHAILFGAQKANDINSTPVLTTQEAIAIDSKVDDGLPGTGHVIGFPQGSYLAPNCSTTSDATTSIYDLSQTGKQCPLYFLMQEF